MCPDEILPTIDLKIATELPDGFPDAEGLQIRIARALKLVLEEFGVENISERVHLSVTLTDDSGIRTINLRHRGLDSSTDVLSFPILDDISRLSGKSSEDPPLLLGDIVLSVETMDRQAVERGLDFIERFVECLVHGVLHVLGEEHGTDSGRRRMETYEDSLMPEIVQILRD